MAITRLDSVLPAHTWTNLYALTGIAAGTAVNVYNKGSNPAQLVIKSTIPTVNSMGVPVYSGPVGSYAYVAAGEVGLWAYSDSGTTLLVQE